MPWNICFLKPIHNDIHIPVFHRHFFNEHSTLRRIAGLPRNSCSNKIFSISNIIKREFSLTVSLCFSA